jgi:integrase
MGVNRQGAEGKAVQGRTRKGTLDHREQAETLLGELPRHQREVIFAFATGLRQANVLGLEWSHVDLEAGHAWVDAVQSKNGKSIAVPLNATTLEVLRRQLGKHPQRVFTYAGKPLATAKTRAWRKALKRAGIENFRWHDTRHTWATWHRQSGTPSTSCSGWVAGGLQ